MERSLKDRYLLFSALGIGWTETLSIPDEEFTYLMIRASNMLKALENNSKFGENNSKFGENSSEKI
jgi:hypothetical protein